MKTAPFVGHAERREEEARRRSTESGGEQRDKKARRCSGFECALTFVCLLLKKKKRSEDGVGDNINGTTYNSRDWRIPLDS